MRKKKYSTARALERKIEEYFRTISRTVTVQERVGTGRMDSHGHEIFVFKPILNDAGEEIKRLDFVVPPTITGLCRYLGMTRESWSEYGRREGYADVCAAAKDVMRQYNEEELLRREGSQVKGVIFNLQNNYGYTDKAEVKVGGVEDYLRSLEGELEL